MKTKNISRHDLHPLIYHPGTGAPGRVAATVIACLLILMVFVVVAALV